MVTKRGFLTWLAGAPLAALLPKTGWSATSSGHSWGAAEDWHNCCRYRAEHVSAAAAYERLKALDEAALARHRLAKGYVVRAVLSVEFVRETLPGTVLGGDWWAYKTHYKLEKVN